MNSLIATLSKDYPALGFEPGSVFTWSPKNKRIIYKTDDSGLIASWSLLHEVGHALLDHQDFNSDFELLTMEVEAWEKAKQLAAQHQITIDDDHIEDCLDTYRDWLYQRSTCPDCTSSSLQTDRRTYECFNCGMTWQVSSSRHCRPYRKKSLVSKR
jgi:hypothetical protein